MRIRSARAVRGVMDVAGTLDHVGGAAGTCDFLWRLRLGLYVVFGRGQAAADLTIGPFRVRLVPSKETKKTPQETKKTGKPKKEPKDLAEAAKKIPKPKLEDLQDAARTLWPAAKKALRRTRRGIRVDPLRLSATLGGAEDPAAAAELYGGLHALVWTGMPLWRSWW